MKSIKVYGPGCKRCEATEAMVRETAERLGIGIEIEKVTDVKAMAMAGVISTPGISVDGTVVTRTTSEALRGGSNTVPLVIGSCRDNGRKERAFVAA